MPYIPQTDRVRLVQGETPKTEGELNFLITDAIRKFVQENERSYATYNAVIGALEAAKFEFYRRVVVPHEDAKCHVNGDVY